MVKFRFFEILVLIVVVGMICLFLHGCHSPFIGENTFIASPSYVVDGNLYIKKADIKLDSARHLILKDKNVSQSNLPKNELRSLCEQGKILTTSEFASNITGYYNTLVSVLVGLFILFSIFGYYALNEKFKKELEEKEQGLEERLEHVVKDKLSDSVTLRGAIISQLLSEVEDWGLTKDEAINLKTDIDKIKDDINTLYELNDELTDRTVDDN